VTIETLYYDQTFEKFKLPLYNSFTT